MEERATKQLLEIEIQSALRVPASVDYCLDCGSVIYKENDSGWEGFLPDGIRTQKLCKVCDYTREN